jgi:hypothetical protein
MVRRIVHLDRTRTTNPRYVRALLSHNDAQTPRPFTSFRDEERLGGHAFSRHILGARPGIADERDLAYRAATNRLVVRNRVVQQALAAAQSTGLRTATAFRNEADALAVINSSAGQVQARWSTLRSRLVRALQPSYAMVVRIPTMTVISADRPGGVYTGHDRPAHAGPWPGRTRGGAYHDPPGINPPSPYAGVPTGTRPLSNTPRDIRSWRRWYIAQQRALGVANPVPPSTAPGDPGEPLTTVRQVRTNRAQIVFRASTARRAHGIRIHTMYPIV